MSLKRRALSALIGGITGTIIGIPLCWLLAIALVTQRKISAFEGASGYAAVYYFLLAMPVVIVSGTVLNALQAKQGWPTNLIYGELLLSVLSLVILGVFALIG